MVKIIEFRPGKELLYSHFETYQFSPDIIGISEEMNLSKSMKIQRIVRDVSHKEPLPSQDSFLETSLFALHNHLFKNPYDSSCWFFDEDQKLWCWRLDEGLHHAYTFDSSNEGKLYNPTVAFPSNHIVVASDGGKNFCVLTGNFEHPEIIIMEKIDCGVLMDARYVKETNRLVIALYCIVEENSKKQSKVILLHYLIRNNENIPDSLELVQRQELLVHGLVDYIYIEETGNFMTILCQDLAKFHYDSLKNREEEKGLSDNLESKMPKYCWSQDEESLTVWLKIPEKYSNVKLDVEVTSTRLSITIGDITLMRGECQFHLESGTSTWSREKDTLKLELMKNETGQMWSELIKGDTGGECLPNETLAAEIHTRLAHLCTDRPGNEIGQPAIGFNAEQLEECDLDGKQSNLQLINLQDHVTSHLAILGTHNRVLFTQKSISTQVFCIRQDYNGCVWNLIENSEDPIICHAHTFPGFGYVEASKSNKKFCIAPPNCSYVAVIEYTRHAFIYEKPDLNAKIARQRIIDLGPDALPIMGATATDEYLILLTKNKLYKMKVETL